MTAEYALLALIAVPVLLGYATPEEAALLVFAGACLIWGIRKLSSALRR